MGLLESESVSELLEEPLILLWDSLWPEGRMEYSPVSQISMLPVAWEADSIRWFWRAVLACIKV